MATDPIDAFVDRVRSGAHRGLLAGGAILQGKTVILLSQRGKGRLYKKYKPRRLHRASSPGDPPATDEGQLRGSIRLVDKSRGKTIRIRVGTNLKSAKALEFGRRGMAPRPFMRPALGLSRKRMTKALVDALRRA